MTAQSRRVPPEPGRPTPREAIAKARAAAGPKVSKAVETAAPAVEKAAVGASRLLGTLAARAKETTKQFREGLAEDDAPTAGTPATSPGQTGGPATGSTTAAVTPPEQAADRPRPRPRPTATGG
jgi:hypothetical protein